METERAAGQGANRRIALAVAPAMVVPLLGALIYFVAFAGESWARWTYVLVKFFTFGWPLIATVWILRRRLPRIDWSAPTHRRALVGGAAFGLALVAVGALLWQTPLRGILLEFGPQIRHKVDQLGVLDHYVPFALFLSLIHSALEEYYWRWFVFGNLRSILGVPVAVAVASIAFASHHFVILTQYVSLPWALAGALAVALGGVAWSLMYERQKTLTGAWVSHILADLLMLSIGYRMMF